MEFNINDKIQFELLSGIYTGTIINKLNDDEYIIKVNMNNCYYQCNSRYIELINKNNNFKSIW